ncbi:hypothetical protein BIY23_03935 [Wolbachia pipientis]|uniref:Bax inhibitor-1/YccA family protein n=1 Tax=Wolbachia pipientis TaxID=955 RepID=A0A1E7QIZ7_WOLPI|nr:Bax inhibitor-1/YccA family protein [Wolbachia pipientis]OEY86440.1 hypothetical protein BIY23_03935 [Wolbachia pipientis]
MKYELTDTSGVRTYVLQVYNYMLLGLLLTGVFALLTTSSSTMMNLIYVIHDDRIINISPFGWLVSLAPLSIALAFSFGLPKFSVVTAQVLFWLYSSLMGISLSSVLLIYTGESVVSTIFIAVSIFGFMSLYGYTTETDLTSLGSFLIMGLIGLITSGLVNLFLSSTALDFAISVVAVIIFTGFVAFDIQRIKSIYNTYNINDKQIVIKIAIFGALQLYLDFINIFVHLLRLLARKKEE